MIMARGRNTSVVSIRLPDPVVSLLKARAEREDKTITELLAPDLVKLSYANFPKVGRNEPCPCGSGLKYKKCHENFNLKDALKPWMDKAPRAKAGKLSLTSVRRSERNSNKRSAA